MYKILRCTLGFESFALPTALLHVLVCLVTVTVQLFNHSNLSLCLIVSTILRNIYSGTVLWGNWLVGKLVGQPEKLSTFIFGMLANLLKQELLSDVQTVTYFGPVLGFSYQSR